MSKLKDLMQAIGDDEGQDDEIEVYADSVKNALELAARELKMDISVLDYEILEKGTSGFFGIGRQPYRVLVRPGHQYHEHDDIDKIEKKLASLSTDDLVSSRIERDADGRFSVRVTKSGVWLTVHPPVGAGKSVGLGDVQTRLYALRIKGVDEQKVEKEVKKQSGKKIRLGDWIPNPEYDGTMSIEVSDDEMSAYVHFIPPQYSGRHMEFEEVMTALRNAGVLVGIREKDINEYLEKMDYAQPLLAAKGDPPRDGRNAYIDYKVRVEKTDVQFEEDEKGQVDFRNLDLLENVVVGQVLAVKVPFEDGIPGRTVTNRVLPAKSGKDTQIKYGKNTILSDDGNELTAATNGQVIFKAGKISVDEVLYIKGDVSLETGNITSLGSVVISGSVLDNFVVKAAGNIEVRGSVQKANIEAEGDIVVKQGIMGRDEARIESTGSSVFAKFMQRANVIAEKDVVAYEGIVHSNVDAGRRILCSGRRARIVGGVIRAGEEVNARFIGSESFTKTELRVGVNPKVLQQVSDLEGIKKQIVDELDKLNKDYTTLTSQRKSMGGKLPKEKEELFVKMTAQQKKLNARQAELDIELEELKSYLGMLGKKGKVCAEKSVFPGVDIFIKNNRFPVKDPYSFVTIALEGNDVRLSQYTYPEGFEDRNTRRRPPRR